MTVTCQPLLSPIPPPPKSSFRWHPRKPNSLSCHSNNKWSKSKRNLSRHENKSLRAKSRRKRLHKLGKSTVRPITPTGLFRGRLLTRRAEQISGTINGLEVIEKIATQSTLQMGLMTPTGSRTDRIITSHSAKPSLKPVAT